MKPKIPSNGTELYQAYRIVDGLRNRTNVLTEQIAGLHQALGLLTTLHPTLEIDITRPIEMAMEIVEYVTKNYVRTYTKDEIK